MRFFRYPQDRLPVLFITSLFALDLTVFALVDSVALLAAWTLVGILPKGWVCAWNHHHQHLNTFEVPLLNRLLEIVFALQTCMSSNVWTLHHVLGHHPNYMNQAKDQSRWRDPDGQKMGIVRYTLEVSATAYPRAWDVSRRYPQHRTVFVGMGLLIAAILVVAFVWRPWPTLFVFVLPMIISLLVTSWATYTHHAGRPTDDHFVASTNIMNKWYNMLTGNLGYHTAHHFRGGVHWSQLPALHERIKHRIPADAYLQPGPPFTWRQPLDVVVMADPGPAE